MEDRIPLPSHIIPQPMTQPIHVGLASFGMSGKVFHAPLLARRTDLLLSHIVERSTDQAHALYPHIRTSRSFDDLLQDSDIGLIVINTPDNTHFDFARRALEHGKHVIVEKPFTQTVDQARTLLTLAEEKGKFITVFHNRRWDGDFLTVQDIIAGTKLGRLVEFISHYDRYRPQIQAGTWKERSSSGSNLLFNLGSHMIDQALCLFGMPDAVTAHLAALRSSGEVNDWYELRLQYPAVKVRLNGSYLVREAGPRYTLHGTDGSFIKFGTDPQEDDLKRGAAPGSSGWGVEDERWHGIMHTGDDKEQRRFTVPTIPGNYSAFYDSVWNSLMTGAAPSVSGSDGLNTMIIIDAALRSAKERTTIDLS
jgi:scyllo-inositol 2-dehydrogenase (NADP+)